MSILPPPVMSEDPESQKTSQRTCRCLDLCLVTSMVLLTMVVGSMGAFYMAWERPHQERSTSERIQRDKLRNSAQLTTDTAKIVNGNIQWRTNRLRGTFLGQDFSYDDTTRELLVKNEGYYYIYSQMALECIGTKKCTEEQDVVSFSVLKNNQEEPILELNIHVDKFPKKRPISSFSANIRYLSANTKLRMEVDISQENSNWQLDSNSFMGVTWFSERSPDELQSD